MFAGESIPTYEINSHTISVLYNLMTRNERQDECANTIIDDLLQKTKEYSAEGKIPVVPLNACSLINLYEKQISAHVK